MLEELHIYNPYSGVTNYQSEGLNRVMKDLQGWKKAPVDCVMLAVYQLRAFYLNEIRRGLAGASESTTSNVTMPAFKPITVWWITFEKIKNGESAWIEDLQIKTEPPDDPLSRTSSVQARAQQLLASNQISFDPRLTRVQRQRHLGCYLCSDHLPQRKLQLLSHPGSQTQSGGAL